MVLPPSVLPASAVLLVCIGVNEMEFAVVLVSPNKVPSAPTSVITPLDDTEPEATYLEGLISQASASATVTSALVAVETASVTDALQADAANKTSVTLERTV